MSNADLLQHMAETANFTRPRFRQLHIDCYAAGDTIEATVDSDPDAPLTLSTRCGQTGDVINVDLSHGSIRALVAFLQEHFPNA